MTTIEMLKSIEDRYDETFDLVYRQLKLSKETTDYTIRDLELFLDSQYVNEGNNWLGRSEVLDAIQGATIAAAETLLHEWKEELTNSNLDSHIK